MSRAASRPSPLPSVSGANGGQCEEGNSQEKASQKPHLPCGRCLPRLAKKVSLRFPGDQCSFQNVIFPFLFSDREARLCNKKNEPLGARPHSSTSAGGVVPNSFNRDYNSGFTFLNN